jgi:molybdenum cofactor synthesis domain-containing protein
MRAAILTLSDKGARGEREDVSGPALNDWLTRQGVVVECMSLIADDFGQIVSTLEKWTESPAYDLIVTTGGTGVSPRDLTPEATAKVIERELPGFAERMRQESLKKTPHAIISRATAGIRGRSLIINLPGSPQGAIENLQAVWPAIPHAIAKIQGDPSDCAPA